MWQRCRLSAYNMSASTVIEESGSFALKVLGPQGFRPYTFLERINSAIILKRDCTRTAPEINCVFSIKYLNN